MRIIDFILLFTINLQVFLLVDFYTEHTLKPLIQTVILPIIIKHQVLAILREPEVVVTLGCTTVTVIVLILFLTHILGF